MLIAIKFSPTNQFAMHQIINALNLVNLIWHYVFRLNVLLWSRR